MTSSRIARSLTLAAALWFAAGCGTQPTQPQSSDRSQPSSEPSVSSLTSRLGGAEGPILCFQAASLDYCYPSGGYCVCPEAEIPYQVSAGSMVTMNWHAEPQPGTMIHSYRWALDIDDVADETPRIDEQTDLSHWSMRSLDATSAQLGPWSSGEVHRLYVDVGDDQGLRSLGIVRFEVVDAGNRPPECDGATAEVPATWPPDHKLAPVTISNVTDPDGDAVTIEVTSVTQDEPLQGPGDSTCPDAMITAGAAQVRIERSGAGNGRVYTIAFTATDSHGATCEGSVEVCVPHDRAHRDCAKDDLIVDSTGPCSAALDFVKRSRPR